MLNIKKCTGVDKKYGEYYIELSHFIEPTTNVNRLGYYCDKAHLRTVLENLKPLFAELRLNEKEKEADYRQNFSIRNWLYYRNLDVALSDLECQVNHIKKLLGLNPTPYMGVKYENETTVGNLRMAMEHIYKISMDLGEIYLKLKWDDQVKGER